MLNIIPTSSLDSIQLGHGHDLARGEIAGVDLGIDLDPGILGDHVVWDGHSFDDGDALVDDGVVLHVGHAQHAVDLLDAEPVQDVGHEGLEAHVLDAGDVLGALEVLARAVGAPLARVVHEVFGHFAQSAPFLAEVDDHAGPALLRLLDGFLDAEDQVRPARADVGAEDVAAVALVVHAQGEPDLFVGHVGRVAEAVDGQPADRGHKDFDVVAGDELGIRAARVFKESSSQRALLDSKPFGHPGQVPDGLDGEFGHAELTTLVDADLAVGLQSPRSDALFQFRDFHVGLGNCDCWSDVDVLVLDYVIEQPGCKMAEGVHGDDLLFAVPCRKGTDAHRRFSVGEVRFVSQVQMVAGDGQGVVYGIGTSVSTDGISSPNGIVVTTDDDRPTFGIIFVAPFERDRVDARLTWIRGEDNAGNGRSFFGGGR